MAGEFKTLEDAKKFIEENLAAAPDKAKEAWTFLQENVESIYKESKSLFIKDDKFDASGLGNWVSKQGDNIKKAYDEHFKPLLPAGGFMEMLGNLWNDHKGSIIGGVVTLIGTMLFGGMFGGGAEGGMGTLGTLLSIGLVIGGIILGGMFFDKDNGIPGKIAPEATKRFKRAIGLGPKLPPEPTLSEDKSQVIMTVQPSADPNKVEVNYGKVKIDGQDFTAVMVGHRIEKDEKGRTLEFTEMQLKDANNEKMATLTAQQVDGQASWKYTEANGKITEKAEGAGSNKDYLENKLPKPFTGAMNEAIVTNARKDALANAAKGMPLTTQEMFGGQTALVYVAPDKSTRTMIGKWSDDKKTKFLFDTIQKEQADNQIVNVNVGNQELVLPFTPDKKPDMEGLKREMERLETQFKRRIPAVVGEKLVDNLEPGTTVQPLETPTGNLRMQQGGRAIGGGAPEPTRSTMPLPQRPIA